MYFNIFNGADLEAMGSGLGKFVLSVLFGVLIAWLWLGWEKDGEEGNNKPVEVLENKLDF